MEWDVIVNGEIEFKWKELLRNLKELSLLRVKRFAFVRVERRKIFAKLYGFCDSSTKIYYAIVCLRVKKSVAVKVCLFDSQNKSSTVERVDCS